MYRFNAAEADERSETTLLTEIPANMIIPNRYQPRKTFNMPSLLRLADSIRRYGILQPITVRKSTAEYGKYEIICGERRYRAGIIAGVTVFSCHVMDFTDSAAAELSIIENLLRDDLNMFEQAEGFELLINTFRLTQEEVASRVSLSQSAVANKLRLLKFSEAERTAIIDNSLTERHARALLRLSDAKARMKFIDIISSDKLNVTATEQLVDNYLKYTIQNGTKSASDSKKSKILPKNIFGAIKDVKLFANSIEKAADILRKTGVVVETRQSDTDEAYVYTITISKECVSRETKK